MGEELVKKGVDGMEEEPISEEDLVLKKKQVSFEKKQASGDLDFEEKAKEQPSWVKWLIIGLVVAGMLAMTSFMGLI